MAEKTPEQIAQEREEKRKASLSSLSRTEVLSLAAAFLANEYTQQGQVGPAINSLFDAFEYLPAITGGKVGDILTAAILNSREDGRSYSGRLTEPEILQSGYAIVSQAVENVYVNDLLGFVGSKNKADPKYDGLTIGEIKGKDKKAYEQIQSDVQKYIFRSGLKRVGERSTQDAVGGLEKTVCTADKKKAA